MESKVAGIFKKVIIIFFAVIGIIVAISGIASGEILNGLLMGAVVFVLPIFLIGVLVNVITSVFSKKK